MSDTQANATLLTNLADLPTFPEESQRDSCALSLRTFRAKSLCVPWSECAMLQEWSDALSKDDEYWDQNAFNDLLKRGYADHNAPLAERGDRLFK